MMDAMTTSDMCMCAMPTGDEIERRFLSDVI